MYLLLEVPKVSSLCSLALKVIFGLVKGACLNSEDDIKAVERYLEDLPGALRLQLAKYGDIYWLDHWDWRVVAEVDPWGPVPNGYKSVWEKYAFWRVASFLPDIKNARLVLNMVGYDLRDCGARALKYLVEDYPTRDIRNTSLYLNFGCRWSLREDPTNPGGKEQFKLLLSRCVLLTEVTLRAHVGDPCLQAVGELCKNLKKLTLIDLTITDDGFVPFVSHQRENPSLEELWLMASRITLKGLSQIWLQRLSIRTLYCRGRNFSHHDEFEANGNDAMADEEEAALLACPAGPTLLNTVIVNWEGYLASASRKVLVERRHELFPSLKRMLWMNPQEDIPTAPNQTWEAVEAMDLRFEKNQVDLPQLAKSFPKLVSLKLWTVKPLSSALKPGSFDCLHRFEYEYSFRNDGARGLPFLTFSSILSEAKSIRVVVVTVAPELAHQYDDRAVCRLFRQNEHLHNLKCFQLASRHTLNSLPLTVATVSCILQTCKGIRVLGHLKFWSVAPEAALKLSRGFRLSRDHLHEYDRYVSSYPFTCYPAIHDFYSQ